MSGNIYITFSTTKQFLSFNEMAFSKHLQHSTSLTTTWGPTLLPQYTGSMSLYKLLNSQFNITLRDTSTRSQ